jgi:hypothetical protein
VKGDDTRLSDSRTPTTHASTHASAGADPVTIAQSQVTNLTTDLSTLTTNVSGKQPLDSELTAIAGLTSAADKGIQFTGSGTAATFDLTTAGKAILDDASADAQLTTLGVTSAGKAILDDADASAQRTTLGVVIDTDVLSVMNGLCQGRLTLTSGTPVTTADVTTAGTLYFTPYKGNKVALYDGSKWVAYTFTERSLSLSGYTSGKPYDIWLYDNAGTPTLESTVWTNDTTRATALAYQDGVLCKSGALTRRYLGTIYTTATGQTADSGGGSDTAAYRCVWNYYNRVPRTIFAGQSTSQWSYTSGAWRAVLNNAYSRANIVIGMAEDAVDFTMLARSLQEYVTCYAGIAVDNTTSPTVQTPAGHQYGGGHSCLFVRLTNIPGIGFHYYQAVEAGGTGGTWNVIFYGGLGSSNITGVVMA